MNLVRCDACSKEVERIERHFEVQLRVEFRTMSDDTRLRHFCSESCVAIYYSKVTVEREVEA